MVIKFAPGSLFTVHCTKTNRFNLRSALGGSRTHNHLIRSQALYPLSYEGIW